MRANQRFYELVVETDFTKEVKDTFTQEIQIEKTEEQIAEKEEQAGQASKSLFIKTINEMKNSMGRIQQHIEYVKNNIKLTEQTKMYTLDVLSTIMAKLASHKIRTNQDFAQKAAEYSQRLNNLRGTETLAKLAA